LDDVIDDIAGSVVDTAGFAHFGLFFNFCLPCGCEADNAAQELLVDLPEDLNRNLVEHIRAGKVGALDDLAQDFVIDLQGGREGVGLAGLPFFLAEVEQTGIVLLVGFLEEKQQMGVDIAALGDLEQLIGGLDLAVLADAQEEDAVDGGLNSIIELALGAVEVESSLYFARIDQREIAALRSQ